MGYSYLEQVWVSIGIGAEFCVSRCSIRRVTLEAANIRATSLPAGYPKIAKTMTERQPLRSHGVR